MSNRVILSGNDAIARGAIESGIKVVTAYPGTPSTEILEYIAKNTNNDVHVEWSVNEKVALETAIGASYSGVRAICCMKHVGVNIATDPLMTLSYTGVNGGLLIVAADDPGMYSSQNEQDSRFYSKFAKIFCFEPSNAEEAKEMTKEAFIVSEKTELPVMLRTLTRVSHTSSPVTMDKIEKQRNTKLEIDRSKWVMIPSNARIRHKVLNEKQKYLLKISENSRFNRIIGKEDKIGVIACGLAFDYAMEFYENDFSILKIGTYPLPVKLIKRFLYGKEKVIVVEEGEPFVEDVVRCIHNNVIGKRSGDIPMELDINPEIIARVLGKDGVKETYKSRLSLPIRLPVMCAGCPHRGTLFALKQNRPRVIMGDIGCYTLGVQKPLEALDSCLCMGASIGKAAGMSQSGIKNVVAVIGESTFLHSGITALLNSVYNKANILVLILDNNTVAMTGHQPTPVSGINARGEKTSRISLEEICRACGVDSVDVVDPYKLNEMKEVINKRLKEDGVRVIIARRECVILRGIGRGKQYTVDGCKACKKCLELGCPAIGFDSKNNTAVISYLCTGCGICAEICPFGAIKKK